MKRRRNYNMPLMKVGEVEDLVHPDFETAKTALMESFDKFNAFFKEHPEKTTKNAVFGELTYFEWKLLNRKHFNHHFEQFGLI